jgi:hypothetical protein
MTSNPGILQSLPLKLNFIPKFSLSYDKAEVVVGIIHLAIPSPTKLDIDGNPCPECSLNLLLSNSEQRSLEFHSTFSHRGHSLELFMFSTPSLAYRVLLVVPSIFLIEFLVLLPKNGLNMCSVCIQVF